MYLFQKGILPEGIHIPPFSKSHSQVGYLQPLPPCMTLLINSVATASKETCKLKETFYI